MKVTNRPSIRCGTNKATPYLKKNWGLLWPDEYDHDYELKVLDLGCGNGRNSIFMKKEGFTNVTSFDMVDDYGTKLILGVDPIPLPCESVDIILCNFVLMFLSHKERNYLIDEIKRVARWKATIMVELYAAKESYAPTEAKLLKMQNDIFWRIDWKKIKYSQEHFIARNVRR